MFYGAEAGGVRTYLSAKAEWLARRTSIQHTVVAPHMPEDRCPTFFAGVPGISIPNTNGFRMLVSTRLAARTLEKLQPDLIEVGDPYQCAWAALRARRNLNVPVVAFYHSDLPRLVAHRFGAAARRAATSYARCLYRQFDMVFAPSMAMVQRLRELGVDRVQHQPLGVDTEIYSPQRRKPGLRAQLGLPHDARLLVFAGRLTREKKLPLLFDALHALGNPYHLLLIGNGELPSMPSRVIRIPFQHDPAALASVIASCDMLVHSGDQETFGLVVLEAMACGIPVAGMAAGGVAELVDDSCGVLVAPGSAADFAEGIHHLYRCDLQKLGENARNKVLQRYDWNLIVPQLVSQYGTLFASRQLRELEHGMSYAAE